MKNITRKSMLACTLCFFIAVTTGCTGNKATDDTDASVSSAQPVEEAPQAEPQAATTEPEVAQTDSIINSKFVREESDIIDGENLTFETSYTFLDGNQGIYCRNFDSQEVRGFTWDDNKIYFCDNTSYDYTIEGDVLKIDGGAGIIEFTKKVETDPVFSGDFSEFAGTYKATVYGNSGFGDGVDIADVTVNADGSVSGGYDTRYYDSDEFPDSTPICVEKLSDGSYYCILSVFPNDDIDEEDFDFDGFVEFGYQIYPAGANSFFSSDPSYSSDKTYIELFQVDGGVYNPKFCKVQ